MPNNLTHIASKVAASFYKDPDTRDLMVELTAALRKHGFKAVLGKGYTLELDPLFRLELVIGRDMLIASLVREGRDKEVRDTLNRRFPRFPVDIHTIVDDIVQKAKSLVPEVREAGRTLKQFDTLLRGPTHNGPRYKRDAIPTDYVFTNTVDKRRDPIRLIMEIEWDGVTVMGSGTRGIITPYERPVTNAQEFYDWLFN